MCMLVILVVLDTLIHIRNYIAFSAATLRISPLMAMLYIA